MLTSPRASSSPSILWHEATEDDYLEIHAAQHGRCAICGGTDDKRRLALDHNHQTGKVRGLLCGNCNRGIGLLRESPSTLIAALNYLAQHAEPEDQPHYEYALRTVYDAEQVRLTAERVHAARIARTTTIRRRRVTRQRRARSRRLLAQRTQDVVATGGQASLPLASLLNAVMDAQEQGLTLSVRPGITRIADDPSTEDDYATGDRQERAGQGW